MDSWIESGVHLVWGITIGVHLVMGEILFYRVEFLGGWRAYVGVEGWDVPVSFLF